VITAVADGSVVSRGALRAGQGEVDGRGDGIAQVVNREGGGQAERGVGSAERDLDLVEVGGRRVGLSVDPVPETLEGAVLDVFLELSVREAAFAGEAVGEGPGERSEHRGGMSSHVTPT